MCTRLTRIQFVHHLTHPRVQSLAEITRYSPETILKLHTRSPQGMVLPSSYVRQHRIWAQLHYSMDIASITGTNRSSAIIGDIWPTRTTSLEVLFIYTSSMNIYCACRRSVMLQAGVIENIKHPSDNSKNLGVISLFTTIAIPIDCSTLAHVSRNAQRLIWHSSLLTRKIIKYQYWGNSLKITLFRCQQFIIKTWEYHFPF